MKNLDHHTCVEELISLFFFCCCCCENKSWSLCPYVSFFTKWEPLTNYEKDFLFHLQSFFLFSRFSDLCISLFFSFSFCESLLDKIDLKVYDLINWQNKNLKIHIVLYLEKESRSDIKTWSMDRVCRILCIKYAENYI